MTIWTNCHSRGGGNLLIIADLPAGRQVPDQVGDDLFVFVYMILKTVIIGTGNIATTRHMPALLTHPEKFTVVGVIDRNEERAISFARKCNLENYATDLHKLKPDWYTTADIVLVSTPPHEHYEMVKRCLEDGKHVLVEKPFTTDLNQSNELVELAKQKNLMLAVNHNFQFSRAFTKAATLIEERQIGTIRSIYCVQITNDKRRLPVWAEELPLGLFYDETPHVFYLLRKFGGVIAIKNVFAPKSSLKKNTPRSINIDLNAGSVPATIYINFESPVCEWYFLIMGEQKLIHVDMFRDIITVLPNDGQHLMREVLTTSLVATLAHWVGIFRNGIDYVRHQLFYGIDEVHERFYSAIMEKDASYLKGISAEDGFAVNQAQWQVIDKT